MKGGCVTGRIWPSRPWPALLLVLALVLSGCQAQEPSLTPAEASFKKEVKDMIGTLSPPLVKPVARGSMAGINVALQKFFSDPKNEPRLCPFKIAVLDKNGVTLGKYPVERGFGVDFSSYGVFQKVLQEGKTVQGRFYLQDGAKIYVICAPLRQAEEVVGILALAMDAHEVGKTCGLPEHKFLALDFNN
jgi:hypothetical protein